MPSRVQDTRIQRLRPSNWYLITELLKFSLQIREPAVKEISGKETKIAFDKVDVPTIVGFFEEENEGNDVVDPLKDPPQPYQ